MDIIRKIFVRISNTLNNINIFFEILVKRNFKTKITELDKNIHVYGKLRDSFTIFETTNQQIFENKLTLSQSLIFIHQFSNLVLLLF